ncbi:hypothetical protein BS47DRAFT_1369587 [Hydnum rufescens UP504]|uniref:Uncharacterized protein n=1 Tax=Hydnum rufescens UP504 TaxID=1448309 RepID=A0A9P6DGE5_9AGAM|nr:hypothetical protein BS47DRAFT_1369587 [Hydnum rufescens UP504]
MPKGLSNSQGYFVKISPLLIGFDSGQDSARKYDQRLSKRRTITRSILTSAPHYPSRQFMAGTYVDGAGFNFRFCSPPFKGKTHGPTHPPLRVCRSLDRDLVLSTRRNMRNDEADCPGPNGNASQPTRQGNASNDRARHDTTSQMCRRRDDKMTTRPCQTTTRTTQKTTPHHAKRAAKAALFVLVGTRANGTQTRPNNPPPFPCNTTKRNAKTRPSQMTTQRRRTTTGPGVAARTAPAMVGVVLYMSSRSDLQYDESARNNEGSDDNVPNEPQEMTLTIEHAVHIIIQSHSHQHLFAPDQ